MASKNNDNRGGSASRNNQSSNTQGENPKDSGAPHRRNRDIARMGNFQQSKSKSWNDSIDQESRTNEEFKNNAPSKYRGKNKKKQPPKEASETYRSTASSAPINDTIYEGNYSGSHPRRNTVSQNFDCSSFPLICERVYGLMETEDSRLRRQLPYCAFLHACTEYLNAFLLQLLKIQNEDQRMEFVANPLTAVGIDKTYFPQPIIDYVQNFGETITANGDKILFNLPDAGIPRGPIPAVAAVDGNPARPALPSGTFGYVTGATHNAYECYVSPHVTKALYNRTLHVNTAREIRNPFNDWRPFPAGAYPRNAVANENLLGYKRPERLSPEGVAKLQDTIFSEGNDLAGRLCHNGENMTRFSNIMYSKRMSFNIAIPDMKPKLNSSACIFLSVDELEQPPDRAVSSYNATLNSPFSFGASAANKAGYYGFKRVRSENIPGTCYTSNDLPIANWVVTRNANFLMAENYDPFLSFDRASLREQNHISEDGVGLRSQSYGNYLITTFKRKSLP